MRIPPGARVYLTTVVSLAGVALATWFGMQAGAAVLDRQWWTLGAVAASVTAAGVPAYEQIRKERMRARAQRAAVDAAVAMRVTMNDALDPIVRQLGRVATAGKHEREALAEAVIPMVLDSAAHLAGRRAERVGHADGGHARQRRGKAGGRAANPAAGRAARGRAGITSQRGGVSLAREVTIGRCPRREHRRILRSWGRRRT